MRLAELEHHVIRDVHDVVDRVLADGFEALPQPIGRRLHFHAAQNASREAAAKFGRFDFDARRIRTVFSADSFSFGCTGLSGRR